MTILYHIPGIGEDNSVGAGGNPALTTVQTHSNLMLNLLAKSTGSSGIRMPQDRLITLGELTAMIPLVETDTLEQAHTLDGSNHYTGANISTAAYGETPSTSMGDWLAVHVGGFVGVWSVGARIGAPYASLANGDIYDDCIRPVSAVQALFGGAGFDRQVVKFVVVQHGESDYNNVNYSGNLITLRSNLDGSIRGITGQLITENVKLLIVQASFAGARISALQQLLATQHSADIYIAAPGYCFPSSGNLRTSVGQRLLGWYLAKAYKWIGIDHLTWLGLTPAEAHLTGSVITCTMNVPVAPMVIDTSYPWGAIANYGIEFVDSTMSQTIISVVVNGPGNALLVTLSGVPTGADPRLKCAVAQSYSNLRDSDPALGTDGTTHLYNWLQHFDVPVNSGAPGFGDMWEIW